MIITISGDIGAGKSTIAHLLAKKLGLKYYSIGGYMRDLAKKRGISLIKMSQEAEHNPAIDKELDDFQRDLALHEDNFVLDSRLGYYFVPYSIKIFLAITPEEGAKRILEQKRPENKGLSYEEILANLQKRELSEKKRYKLYYGINFPELEKFDLVIDTSNKSSKEVLSIILEWLNKRMKNYEKEKEKRSEK